MSGFLICRRFQGFGFCEFHDMRDAEDAQAALDGKLFGGRTLEVRHSPSYACPSCYLHSWLCIRRWKVRAI
jgi:RNA recognition motif-containing protein